VSASDNDQAFLDGSAVAMQLLRHPAVAERWAAPSALERMTVGMLACHLSRQFDRVAEILSTPGTTGVLPQADDHYRRAAWVSATDLDDPALDRSEDEQQADLGPEAMINRATEALATVESMITTGPLSDVATIPWQGWSLRRNDFLLTRMVELVTHTDDLARSVDLATPDFPAAVYHPVAYLLLRLAVERHGQSAVTSALTRTERAPRTISAF
jgi:hypothetical protein